jgi:hypothetical protein
MPDKAKPVHKIQHRGIAVAIWKNEAKNGPFYSVTLSRRYKHGEEWKDGYSYDQDDLLLLAELAKEAHAWMRQAARSARQAKREAA